MEIEGVLFTKICNISPQLDSDGAIREFYPAGRYDNAKGLRLNPNPPMEWGLKVC